LKLKERLIDTSHDSSRGRARPRSLRPEVSKVSHVDVSTETETLLTKEERSVTSVPKRAMELG
jgi:hypothetical protein